MKSIVCREAHLVQLLNQNFMDRRGTLWAKCHGEAPKHSYSLWYPKICCPLACAWV